MDITAIVNLALLGLSVIGLIISIIVGIKKGKLTTILQIIAKIPTYCSQAEKIFGAGTGAMKLQYVLNKINIDCVNLGVTFDEEEMTTQIEAVLTAPQKKSETETDTTATGNSNDSVVTTNTETTATI